MTYQNKTEHDRTGQKRSLGDRPRPAVMAAQCAVSRTPRHADWPHDTAPARAVAHLWRAPSQSATQSAGMPWWSGSGLAPSVARSSHMLRSSVSFPSSVGGVRFLIPHPREVCIGKPARPYIRVVGAKRWHKMGLKKRAVKWAGQLVLGCQGSNFVITVLGGLRSADCMGGQPATSSGCPTGPGAAWGLNGVKTEGKKSKTAFFLTFWVVGRCQKSLFSLPK